MDRRTFIGNLALAPLAWFGVARAQPATQVPRIGFLSAAPLSSITARTDALLDSLREQGYVEGRTIVIDWRSADENWVRLPALATELVRLNVALIVTAEGPAAVAAHQVTRKIPIVMAQSADPVGIGLAQSFARPGGNVTGLTTLSSELPGKQLELLQEAVPTISRVAILSNPANPSSGIALKHVETPARTLGVRLQVIDAAQPKDLDRAFAAMTRDHVDGLVVLPDPMFLSQRTRIADLAAGARVPAIYGIPEHVVAGGLMGYAANRADMFRRAAVYVDKILKGANPADMPIEQPIKFDFVINLKTAKALGLVIPQALLLRASDVIQ